MEKFIEKSIKKYFQLRQFRVMLWRKNQIASQELLLAELIANAEMTSFGVDHQFSEIVSLEDYQSHVPVRRYEDVYPYIKRMLENEANVLWPGRIEFFSKSSGTTNDTSKYIPVSYESLYENNYKAGRDIYTFFFMNEPESRLLEDKGSVISLSGSFQEERNGIKIGDVSAIMASQLPVWAQKRREPSLSVALMSEWKDKIPAMIQDTLGKNITHLSGVPTWFVSMFDEMKKIHPYKDLRDIWPNLELFIHGAVAFEPYRKIFEQLVPYKDMKYLEVYNASEGFFAIQDNLKKQGEMVLLTDHGVFYEFITMDEYFQDNRTAVPLKRVKKGVHYAMIITTNAGLWRYDVGDTVQFTSIKPYRIKITGRTQHFLNLCGEELMVGNTDQAVSNICNKTGVSIEQYTVGPIFMDQHGKAGHEWIIEFKQDPQDIHEFTRLLDNELQKLNSDYRAKRQNNIALQLPTIHQVPVGTFMKWLEKKGKLGGQHKVPRLSNKREILEEILKLDI